MIEYIESFTGESANSLVLLKSADKILDKLFITPVKTVYIWIDESGSKNNSSSKEISSLQKKLNSSIIVLSKSQDLKKLIEEKCDRRQKVVIIQKKSSINLEEDRTLDTIQKESSFFSEQNYSKKCMVIPNVESQMFSVLKQNKQTFNYKELPNFISLDSEVWNANVQVKTMVAMINQKVNRNQIIDALKQLVEKIRARNELLKSKWDLFLRFLEELELKHELSIERAIYWYTVDSPIFGLVNNLLGSATHPSETYYIQPLFKDLFMVVKTLSKNQWAKKECRQFVCYRGDKISEKEIKEIEKNNQGIMQNIGFFSTTLKKEQAQKCMQNVMFQIQVKNIADIHQNSNGFAFISEYSRFKQQEEVLFNPLNSFKVVSIEMIQLPGNKKRYQIKLVYGELARLMGQSKNLTPKQSSYKTLGQIHLQQSKRIQCQGNVLIDEVHQLPGSQIYWQKYYDIAKTSDQKYSGLNHKALSFKHKGNYEAAKRQYSKCQQLITSQLKKLEVNPSQIRRTFIYKRYAQLLNNKAIIYQALGDNDNALVYYKKCLPIKQKLDGKCSVEYVSTLVNIGIAYKNNGNMDLALESYQKALQIEEGIYGKNHPEYARILNSIGIVYEQKGELAKASQIYKNSLKIFKEIQGQNHPNYSATLNNLGVVSKNMQNYDDALKYFSLLILIRKKTVGEEHSDFALTLNNIASVYLEKDELGQAEQHYLKALQIQSRTIKNTHPDYAHTLSGLASVALRKGSTNLAKNYYNEALKIQQKSIGRQHLDYAQTLGNLAFVWSLEKQKQSLETSAQYYKKAMEIVAKKPGCSKMYCEYALELKQVYFQLKQYSSAIRQIQETIRILKRQILTNQTSYFDCFSSLGDIYTKTGQYDKALQCYRTCQTMERQSLDKSDGKLMELKKKISQTQRLKNKNS